MNTRKHLLSLCLLLTSFQACFAQDLKLGYGRLLLLDLGSKITGKVLVDNSSLVTTYPLSAFANEDQCSVVALQGLNNQGETDLSISTNDGIKQFHIQLDDNSHQDLILNPIRQKISTLLNQNLKPERSTIITSPDYINEFVLAGNPNLISAQEIVTEQDPNYLKTFKIKTSVNKGCTDLVIATNRQIYKLSIEIGDKHEHQSQINLANLPTSI